eukprot:1036445_1
MAFNDSHKRRSNNKTNHEKIISFEYLLWCALRCVVHVPSISFDALSFAIVGGEDDGSGVDNGIFAAFTVVLCLQNSKYSSKLLPLLLVSLSIWDLFLVSLQ